MRPGGRLSEPLKYSSLKCAILIQLESAFVLGLLRRSGGFSFNRTSTITVADVIICARLFGHRKCYVSCSAAIS